MPAPGPAGRNLIANVERLRQERGLSLNRLSAELERAGRPIPPLGLSRIARAERRVDVDEFLALAEVLGTTPGELLAPPDAARSAPPIDHPAIQAAGTLAARIGQLLATSGEAEALSASVDRGLRRVQIEVEELLAETKRAHGLAGATG
jgi:transcriptional regulator with XRE-family HTH domain